MLVIFNTDNIRKGNGKWTLLPKRIFKVIPALPFIRCVTLSRLLKLCDLSLLIHKIGITVPTSQFCEEIN